MMQTRLEPKVEQLNVGHRTTDEEFWGVRVPPSALKWRGSHDRVTFLYPGFRLDSVPQAHDPQLRELDKFGGIPAQWLIQTS